MGWHNQEVFELPQSEREIYYARVPDECTRYKAARMLAVPMPVVYACLTGIVMEDTVHERRLIRRIAEMELNVLLRGTFFRLVRYGAVMRLGYERMVVGSQGYDALVRVPTTMIEDWFGLGILRLIRNMKVDPMLALVPVARVAEVSRAALPDQKGFTYDYVRGMLVSRPGEGVAADQNAGEGEGEGGRRSVVRADYPDGSATRVLALAFARETRRRCLAKDVNYLCCRP